MLWRLDVGTEAYSDSDVYVMGMGIACTMMKHLKVKLQSVGFSTTLYNLNKPQVVAFVFAIDTGTKCPARKKQN